VRSRDQRGWADPRFELRLRETPIRHLTLRIGDRHVVVALKLEGQNDCGSIKYRTAWHMVRMLERQQRIRRGSTLIESTSGNLGVALACICAQRGYRFVAVVDPKVPTSSLDRMRAYGAEIEMVHQPDATGGYLLSRLARVAEICSRAPGYVWTNQYANPANPAAHYRSTAPELLRQTGGRIDCIFIAVSTGGTLAGVARYLREAAPAITIVAVDAHGSVVFADQPGPRRLNGIGSSRRSEFLSPELYDTHLLVGDEEAFAYCRAVHAAAGLQVGGSSGAVLAACVNHLAAHQHLSHPLCLCADDGSLYAETIFSDAWLSAQGLTVSAAWARSAAALGLPTSIRPGHR
jgi:N-(2-amino-2-carboxyethyl)-L-glutamate synthase